MAANEVAGLDWAANRLIPGFQTPQQLDVYDIRGASREAQLTITTMAGLINRPQPKVYLLLNDPQDDFWLKTVFPHVQYEYAPARNDDALEAMLIKYRDSVQGLIIYNPDFTDSINVATTLAGQRQAIIVSPAQARALQTPFKLATLFDLNQFQWRTRFQAYTWAYENLLAASTSRMVAGLDPGGPFDSHNRGHIALRSFLVATNTFAYWLDSRDILPDITDPLSSEHKLMEQLLSRFPAGATHLGWFIDEPGGVGMTSRAAMPVLASDLFSNLEVFAAIPASTLLPPPRSVPASQPARADRVYVSFTVSDGDNLQYCARRMQTLWNDSARGSIPIGWTISPALLQAAPSLATYYASTATANDELIAGPSGAGYIFPSLWPSQKLPAFLEQTGQLMRQMNLSLLEILDSTPLESSGLPVLGGLRATGQAFSNEQLQEQFVQALAPYGVQGLLSGSGTGNPEWKLVDGMPIYRNIGLANNVSQTVSMITNAASYMRQRPLFLNVYIMAWNMKPGDLKQVAQQLGSGYEIVTPGTLLAMLRQQQS
ncbi:MAG TPA: GxGYxYP domain-containing protein [Ktedonobacteraceae bacterium]|nr:GxGYxYP domain-containing protein [Ktedonobacteraceae bacterium]